ncbi:RagB/SusD family nutrient uptake outer membrane protein [Compostibacter hankyongensis]|uniref:RagB/SusD family nutrient uptake outer membrane protein n=2 Tax=Compostibacter hankyongensis TaxID=1007089 RepID=A0ABP8FIQ3_9BACT
MFGACNKYLDIIPDNIATIDYAFRLRSTAERFLFTCYSYVPDLGTFASNPALSAGDELWLPPTSSTQAWQIARGNQRVVNPYMNYWQGSSGANDIYEGIRQCNIFLENIALVPDMDDYEKKRWIAEVKFLKAYYHFWLLRSYGPIVLIKENLPVSAGPDEVKIPRSPVDSCFDYVVQLLDEAASDLPDKIDNEASELGRVTKAIDLSFKAYVLVTAASPLFNGNQDYKGFANRDGTPLFNTTVDPAKWEKAAAACKTAVEFCQSLGYKLYYYNPQLLQYDLSDTTMIQMNIRNAICERWNSEIIWGNTNSPATSIQASATPRGLDPAKSSNSGTSGSLAPPLKIAEMFYSNHGVPITEDKTWDYAGRFRLRTADSTDKYTLKEGYITAQLNFDREPRYYADLGFDGGIWYGQGHYDDKGSDLLYVSSKKGQPAAPINLAAYSTTGYTAKKLVNFNNVIGDGNTYTVQYYPWPMIRLADLYLLYAEAQNEVSGPGAEVYKYIDSVRARAGLPSVAESWSNYSRNPNKYTTKEGMRDIIHQERLIEMAFEGQRYWDLRRWKEATTELNKPITGWDLDQSEPAGYYRQRLIFNQTFTTRDYLWPLNENTILANSKLVQNPGW